MSTGQPPIQSITRAIAVLQCFTGTKELSIADISRMLNLHKNTTAGIVRTLKFANFLEHNTFTGKYRLGFEIFRLAANVRPELSDVCEPYVIRLAESTGETANFAIRDGDQILYVIKKESSQSMRISTHIGARFPLYSTAIGKAILAFMSPDIAKSVVNNLGIVQFTKHTVADINELTKQLESIRENGVAYDLEENEYGLTCIAAPVFNKHNVAFGAVSVSGPTIRMDSNALSQFSVILKKTARAITEDLLVLSITDGIS